MDDDLSHDGQLRTWARSLVELQPSGHESGVAEWLNRLCRAVAQEVHACAVTITVGAPSDTSAVLAADAPVKRRFAEAEYAVGEGPTYDAWRFRRPVLITELGGPHDGAWPGYTTKARSAGILAAFAFPLQVGAVRVGVLSLYRDHVGSLGPADLTTCLVMAELATERLISSTSASSGGIDPSLDDAVSFRSEIYQAQGMVAVAHSLSLGDSLAALRAHAFQTGRDLIDVAFDIVHNGYRLADDQHDHDQEPDRYEDQP